MNISKDEFEKRAEKVNFFLRDKKLGGVAVFSVPWGHLWHQTGHIGYLSNWAGRDRNVNSIILITPDDAPVLLFAGLPYMADVIREVSWIRDIRMVAPEDPRAAALPGGSSSFGGEIKKILYERHLGDKKFGISGAQHMPLSVWRSITGSIPESQIDVSFDVVEELRCVKSLTEVKLIRRAAELSDLGYDTLVKTARAGMRGYEVVAEMEHAVRSKGADFVQFWFISGPSDGWQDTWPIVSPHPRVLEKGDQIICGSYVVYKGYWAHGMRAGTLGGLSPQQERYMPACLDIYRAAGERLRPGAAVSEVVKAALAKGRQTGFQLSSPRIGHGIGMDYSEMPFMIESNSQELGAGMVAVIHPQITLPDTGTFIVPVGDMFLLTDRGTEPLMRFPVEPFRA